MKIHDHGATGRSDCAATRHHCLLPVVMYFHGGGWVTGDKETHDRLIREIAVGAEAAVVFVEYPGRRKRVGRWRSRKPNAVTKWIFETGKMINVDPQRIAVAGDSAGGNIAAAVTLLAKERGDPKSGFKVLFLSGDGAKFDTKSYDDFAEGQFFNARGDDVVLGPLRPKHGDTRQSTASPLRASLEELQGLPPAVIITAECDVLRDEGEAYAARLKEAGVPVSITRYPGMIHDFVMLKPCLEPLQPTRHSNNQTKPCEGLSHATKYMNGDFVKRAWKRSQSQCAGEHDFTPCAPTQRRQWRGQQADGGRHHQSRLNGYRLA